MFRSERKSHCAHMQWWARAEKIAQKNNSCQAWQYTRLDTRISNEKGWEREKEQKWGRRGKRKRKKKRLTVIKFAYLAAESTSKLTRWVSVCSSLLCFSVFVCSLSDSIYIRARARHCARARLFRTSSFVQTKCVITAVHYYYIKIYNCALFSALCLSLTPSRTIHFTLHSVHKPVHSLQSVTTEFVDINVLTFTLSTHPAINVYALGQNHFLMYCIFPFRSYCWIIICNEPKFTYWNASTRNIIIVQCPPWELLRKWRYSCFMNRM